MMLKYASFNLIFLINLVIQVHSIHVEFSPNEVEFTLNVNASVTVTVSEHNGSDSWLILAADEAIEFYPSKLFFSDSKQDEVITLVAKDAGFGAVFITNSSSPVEQQEKTFLVVLAFRLKELQVFTVIVGWGYFVAWSLSFYPQILKNFTRKSVVGFNLDFLTLNTLGHSSYLFFNAGLYFVPTVQTQYFATHKHSINPVQLNDVLFSIHGVFATSMQCIQCCIYERGGQVISKACRVILICIFLFLGTSVVITICNVITWLTLLNYFSYVKLGITFIKYCPQVYTNYKAKSTAGFSVGYAILDFLGGSQSILQMFVINYNFDDWSSITGDFTKLGLGLVSMIFDVIFIIQHYCVYSHVILPPEPEKKAYVNDAFDTTTHL